MVRACNRSQIFSKATHRGGGGGGWGTRVGGGAGRLAGAVGNSLIEGDCNILITLVVKTKGGRGREGRTRGFDP